MNFKNIFRRKPVEKDLIIGDRPDQAVTEDDFDEVEPDDKDYAGEAYYLMQTYATVAELDTKIMNKAEARRIEQIKKYCLRVAHLHIKQVYEENFIGDLPQAE
jgi:hypothetical protein